MGGILLGIAHLLLWDGILLSTCALAGGAELLRWPCSFMSWWLPPVLGLSAMPCLGMAAAAPLTPSVLQGWGCSGQPPKLGCPFPWGTWCHAALGLSPVLPFPRGRG